MPKNPFQHIDLRVRDMDEARAFYSRLMPALGFVTDDPGKSFHCYVADGKSPSRPWFGFTEDREHRPNANRVAFWAETREEVDRLGAVAVEAGAQNVSGPRACPEYTPSYYAIFFDDPSGNPLEICYVED